MIHIFNRTIPVVGVSKKLSNCLILKLSSKHGCHAQGYTNLSRYAKGRVENDYDLEIETCK
jgi:hypothetical protein